MYTVMGSMLLDAEGNIKMNSALTKMVELSATNDLEKMAVTFGESIKNAFPTMADRLKDEQLFKVAEATGKLDGLSESAKYWGMNPLTKAEKVFAKIGETGLYKGWRSAQKFMGLIQVSLSPVTQSRNFIQNTMTVISDYGFGAVFHKPGAMIEEIKRMGMFNPRSVGGFTLTSFVSSADEIAKSGGNLIDKYRAWNGKIEQWGKIQSYRASINNTINTLRREGALLGDAKDYQALVSAIGKDNAVRLTNLQIREFSPSNGLNKFLKGDRFTMRTALTPDEASLFEGIGLEADIDKAAHLPTGPERDALRADIEERIKTATNYAEKHKPATVFEPEIGRAHV
jgi:hypothetical protein